MVTTKLQGIYHKNKPMGIKNLNQFLRKECSEAIKIITLTELAGKVVVVDASIFMYRFLADDALLENMYSMISFFQMHNIVAVFVFDGKPPDEKRKTLNRRRHLKHVAEMQYNQLVRQTNTNPDAPTLKNGKWFKDPESETEIKLKILRRRFIRVSDADFERVWSLMRSLGVQYIVAHGEADAMCAQMVLKRKAYACVSDDTDLLVYGCCRVLRHINLFDQTITMYDMHKILNILGITMREFRQICVISGTDYNSNVRTHSLKHALQLFKQYKLSAQQAEDAGSVFAPDFYTWLHHACNDCDRIRFDYDTTTAVYNMFDMTIVPNQNNLPTITQPSKAMRNDELLREVMAHENFIFAV